MLNILFYNNVHLWPNQSIVFLDFAKRFVKHNIYYLKCNKNLYSCPANSYKSNKTCNICLIKQKSNFNILKKNSIKEIEFKNTKRIVDFKYYTFEDIENIKYKNLPLGEITISQICDDLKSDYFTKDYIKINRERINRIFESAINLYEETIKTLDKFKIDKVYIWNGRRPSDGPVAYACKHKNIKFKTLASQAPNEYVLSRGTKIQDLKNIKYSINNFYKYASRKKAQNIEQIYNEFIERKINGLRENLNFGNENIATKQNEKFFVAHNYVSFFTSSSYEIAGFADWKSHIYKDQYDCLEQIINDERLKDLKIIIRWHPMLKKSGKYELERVNKIINQSGSNVINIKYNSKVNSLDILKQSKKTIFFGSTLCFEANYFKIPAINLTSTAYDDLEIMHKPKTHTEFVNILKSNIESKESKKVIYFALMEKMKFYNFQIKNYRYDFKKKYYQKNNERLVKINILDRLKIKLLNFFYD